MKAVVIHETGGPEVLRWEEAPNPEPDDAEVLIRVHAAGVNPVDWKRRSGNYDLDLPTILGNEASGTVQQSRAEGFAEGDEVFGYAASGAYAELAATPATTIARKPEGVAHEQASTIQVAAQTAWQSLFDVAGLESGQTALIIGASGGVGHYAVQLAKQAGARVIGTGSSRNRDFVLGLGADEYVDYTEQDIAEAVNDADVTFDTMGAETEKLVSTVREGGFLVVIASAPPEEAAKERGIRTALHVTEPNPDELGRIADLIAAGDVRVEIQEVIPIAEARRSHELSESGHVRGKLVLAVSG
ncbi:MAG: NADP-dependent oxidoreductase [Solirubrobacterales bacterium]